MAKAKPKKEKDDEGQSEKLLDLQRKYPRSRGKQLRRDAAKSDEAASTERREPEAKLAVGAGDRSGGNKERKVPARKVIGTKLPDGSAFFKATVGTAKAPSGTVHYQGRCKLNPDGDTSYSGRARK
jgi:hypothetical protein